MLLATGYDRIALWPPVHRNILWSFRHTSNVQLFLLDEGGGRKTSPNLGSETILGRHSYEEVERKSATIIKRCILLIKFLKVPDKN